MLTREDEYIKAIESDYRKIHVRINTAAGVALTNNDIETLKWDADSGLGSDLAIGGVTPAELDVTLFGQWDEVLSEGTLLEPSMGPQRVYDGGIILETDTIYWKPLGKFRIRDIFYDANNDRTKIKASDLLGDEVWGRTVGEIFGTDTIVGSAAAFLSSISSSLGIGGGSNSPAYNKLAAASLLLPVGGSGPNGVIDYWPQLRELTCKEAIGMLAQRLLGFVYLNRSGMLDIKIVSNPSALPDDAGRYTLGLNQIYDKGVIRANTPFKPQSIELIVDWLRTNQPSGDTPVYSIVRKDPDAGDSGIKVDLFNKTFRYSAMNQEAANLMYKMSALNNLYPHSVKWTGDPSLELGDALTVPPLKSGGTGFDIYVAKYSLSYNGGLSATTSLDLDPTKIVSLNKNSGRYVNR